MISDLANKKQLITTDLQEFEEFSKTEVYTNIPNDFKLVNDKNKTELNCREIIKKINLCDYSFEKRLTEIRDEITQFTGVFSAENIFHFKTVLNKTEEFLQFAEDLSEFIEENKIERFEKEINSNFAYIILAIGKEKVAEILSDIN